jgi:hypothetical protein
MEITNDGDVRLLVTGNIRIPVRGSIYDVIEDVKKLSPEAHTAIIQGEGLEVPPGLENKVLLYAAMSFVQNAWYATTSSDGVIPAGVLEGHTARLADFEKKVARARAHPPAAGDKKAPTEVKFRPITAMTARISGRRYRAAPDGDAAAGAALKGQRKVVYDAVVALTGSETVAFEEVLAGVKERGLALKGGDGGRGAVAYHLKELVTAKLVLLSPAQAEIPGTPEPVADIKPDPVETTS